MIFQVVLYFKDKPISGENRRTFKYHQTEDDEYEGWLNIYHIKAEDAGKYVIKVKNSLNEDSVMIQIKVILRG